MPVVQPRLRAATLATLLALAAASVPAAPEPAAKPASGGSHKSVVTVASPDRATPSATPEADALVHAADELRRKGDLEGALAKCKEALRKAPQHPQGLLLAGTLEGATNRLDDAVAHLRQAVALMPDNLLARKVYATALIQTRKLADATEVLAPVLKATPIDPQAYAMAAQIAASNSDFDQARKYIDKALSVDPGFVPAHQVAIRIAAVQHRPDEARRHLQAVVKAHPDDADAWMAMASLEASQSRNDAALADLEQARKVQPKQPGPLIASSEMALHLHRLEEAGTWVGKLEAMLPGSLPALSLRGQLLMAQGHPREAVEPLQAAVAKQPVPEVFLQLHEALLASGQQAEAQRRMGQWLKDHPDDDNMRFVAAESSARHGDFADAVANFRKLLEKHPDNLLALNDLAQSLQAQHDPAALEVAEKAWKLQPDNPVTENTLGGILMANGKSQRGLDLLRQAAGKAKDNPEARFDYARALAASGDKAGAKAELEAVLNLKRPFPDEAAAREMLKSLSGS